MTEDMESDPATFQARIHSHTLTFTAPASTSKGTLTRKTVHYLLLQDKETLTTGIGECSPLSYLSPEYGPDYSKELQQLATDISKGYSLTNRYQAFQGHPSVQFGIEQAYLDWIHGGKRLLFESAFSRGDAGLPINGLIWMNDAPVMRQAIQQKLAEGFTCLKLKIGALDWEEELNLIRELREQYPADALEIRVDANGAFREDEAFSKLESLAAFQVHSIEQPLPKGSIAGTARLCRDSALPIALDEELIGYTTTTAKAELLDQIQPAFIIMKPSLVGGFQHADEWISLASERNTGWWATSALESNIGLNAIAQWTATYPLNWYQGLGTGGLYTNNIPAPLYINNARLFYDPAGEWDLSLIPE